MIYVNAELDVMGLMRPRKVIHKLIAVLGAMYEAERLASKECDSWHVDRDSLAIRERVSVASGVPNI